MISQLSQLSNKVESLKTKNSYSINTKTEVTSTSKYQKLWISIKEALNDVISIKKYDSLDIDRELSEKIISIQLKKLLNDAIQSIELNNTDSFKASRENEVWCNVYIFIIMVDVCLSASMSHGLGRRNISKIGCY